jgi:hypothetical protein
MVLKDRTLLLAFGVLAILVVGLAVVGGFRFYSPVPFADMWHGYIGFYTRVADGYIGAWWDPHNEHRIVLAHALFWTDLRWFGGAGWFLIAANYFFVGASAFMFWRILRAAATAETPATAAILPGLFVTAWLFQWMQYENLTWAFQSQFILAQLLPLCAMYWLHKSAVESPSNRYFLIACGFGVASVGTMANGILALPLMAFCAFLMRQRLARVGLLAALSVATLFLYFHSYEAVHQYGSLWQALEHYPSRFVQYVLLYLGSPFHYLSGGGEPGKLIAQVAGLVLVGGSAWFAIKALRKPREMTLQLAMLFFILYVGGTAFGTAGGRLILGANQALSSRYTTPALMAWSALFVLYSPSILAAIRARNTKSLLLFAVLGLQMVNLQRQALRPQDDELFERKIAALALELHINDRTQIRRIYRFVEPIMPVAEKASAQNVSVFGMYPFRDAREQLGTSVQQPNLPACKGYLETVELIDGDTHFVRVSGWIFDSIGRPYPQVVRFINSQSQEVGYALIGKPRPDIANSIDKKALQSGYRGYLWSDQMGATLKLQAEGQAGPSCQMQASVPVALFPRTSTRPSVDSVSLARTNITFQSMVGI